MAQENWQRVKDIFVDVMQQKPEVRQDFLKNACKGNEEIRHEVESLLSSYDDAESFLEVPAVIKTRKTSIPENPQFTNGQNLKHYKIIKQIGKGGMGEVYLAQDTKLKRKVALKLLSTEFTNNKYLLRRFEQEALAASRLNHPNILTIYEFGNTEDNNFIVTEFVVGKTLSVKLQNNLMNLGEVLDIVIQTNSALVTAHKAGIIHRDIKPDNIMIRKDKIVKILDFGLAKLAERKIDENIDLEATTLAKIKTIPGMVMGTPQYMSPEQARGKEVDGRGDIFSLGVVLYQMLSGILPFEGESTTDIISSIIKDEPKPLNNNEVPPQLVKVVNKTLQKDKNKRYQTSKDLLVVLKSVRKELELKNKLSRKTSPNKGDVKTQLLKTKTLDGDERTLALTQKSDTIRDINIQSKTSGAYILRQLKGHKLLSIIIFAIFLATSIWFGYWYYSDSLSSSSSDSVQISELTRDGTAYNATVSPDGKLVAYVDYQDGKSKLIVKQIATGSTVEIVPLTSKNFAFQPTFSPDGEYIYYVLYDEGVGILYRVSTLGGKSREIVVDVDSSVSFSPDGKQLAFLRHNADKGGDTAFIVSLYGGRELKPIIKTKEIGYNDFNNVDWSNDGKELNIAGYKSTKESKTRKRGFIAVSVDGKKTVSELSQFAPLIKSREVGAWRLKWLKDNSGVVFLGRKHGIGSMQIWSLTFSNGEIKQITNDTSEYFSVSFTNDMNTMVATKSEQVSTLSLRNLKTGQSKQIIGESKSFSGNLGFSQTRDGKILYSKIMNNGVQIFSIDEDGDNETQLTFETGFNKRPIASPNGKYIIFVSARSGKLVICRMDSDGSNKIELTKSNEESDDEPQITSDSETVIFTRSNKDNGKQTLMYVSIDGGEVAQLIPESQTSDYLPKISPDGKKLAYFSYKAGTDGSKKQVNSFLKIHAMEKNTIGKLVDEFNWSFDRQMFNWSSDSKSIIFNMPDGKNLSSLSLKNRKDTPLTSFISRRLWNFFPSDDGEKIFFVRGTVTSDLVLIRKKENDLQGF